VADYIFKPDEAFWPPYFTQAFVYLLAAMLGGAVARDADLVEKYEKMAKEAFAKAANIESQSQTTRRVRMTRFLTARGNTRDGGFRDDGY
jgi:hypothetical protein